MDPITNKREVTTWSSTPEEAGWEELVLAAAEFTFLQSWQQGELQKQMGNEVLRYVWSVEGQPVLLAQIVVIAAKRGKVMQLRHAPLFLPAFYELSEEQKVLAVHECLADLRELAQERGCDFVRLQSLVRVDATDNPLLNMVEAAGYSLANVHNIDAEKTLYLDITPGEEELQRNMRKQTRYYVRKAEKMGVVVETHKTPESLEQFYTIHHDTTIRRKFKSFSHKYYQNSFAAFNALPDSKLEAQVLLAKYEGKYIAGAIIVFYGNRAFYSDGGSLTAYAKIPASYLIQWTAIRDAKARGCETYNFWGGVSPDRENTNYPWYGIDLFKRGFGGHRVDYMHAHDLGLTWRYHFTRIWEYFERVRRGY